MHELLVESVNLFAPVIEGMGIVVVVWGAVEGAAKLLARIADFFCGRSLTTLECIRAAIGQKRMLGLDFFLAGDIIQTIVIPTPEKLAMLGGIVVIRTALAYFLGRDLKEMHQ